LCFFVIKIVLPFNDSFYTYCTSLTQDDGHIIFKLFKFI
jgi:hypothetical protein